MNSDQVFETAHRMARELGITHAEALSRLGKAGAEKRRRARYGLTRTTVGDRSDFDALEQPNVRYWWKDGN